MTHSKPPPTPMIERLAKQIALEIMEVYIPAEVAAFSWPDDASGDTIDRARSRATAILTELKEPSDKMKNCAVIIRHGIKEDGSWGTDPEPSIAVWKNWIDAILEGRA